MKNFNTTGLIFALLLIPSYSFAEYTGPDLKMPMEPGDSILCTVEAGGKIASILGGGTDGYHTGNGYYALDFDDRYDGDIAVAAANGSVSGMLNSGCYQGGAFCYVKLNHEGGYTTSYLHLKQGSIPSGISIGSVVKQGQKLGDIGTTGDSTGPHLHFALQYNGQGSVNTEGLDGVILDGIRFVDYVAGNYYESTNDGSSSSSDDSDSSSDSSCQVKLAEINANSHYDIYTWYYKDESLNIFNSDEPVEDTKPYLVGDTKKWFSGKITSGDYQDILTSFTSSDGKDREFYVYSSRGNGEFESGVLWKEKKESNVDKVFLKDTDGDGFRDLILSNKNSDDKFEWKRCKNQRDKFEEDCEDWDSSEEGGTFGNPDDVILAGKFSNKEKAQLLRGRPGTEDCLEGLKWRQMNENGNVSNTMNCWGFTEELVSGGTYKSQYLVGDIDDDGFDEVVQIRINVDAGVVQVFRADYNSSTGDFDTSAWTKEGSDVDIGGSTGWYYLANINNDDYLDLVRWSAEGNIVWMKNDKADAKGVLKKAKTTLIKNRNRNDDDILLFGDFGKVPGCTSGESYSSAGYGGGEISSYSNETDDSDGDGLTDLAEYYLETDAWDADSDEDGYSDYQELEIGTDPLVYDTDDDGDGLTNAQEATFGTDPSLMDSDNDGFSDYDEVTDADKDGLTNAEELSFGTDPNLSDSNTNGVLDYEEYQAYLIRLNTSYSVGGVGGCSLQHEFNQ